jgi:hypothetical protein
MLPHTSRLPRVFEVKAKRLQKAFPIQDFYMNCYQEETLHYESSVDAQVPIATYQPTTNPWKGGGVELGRTTLTQGSLVTTCWHETHPWRGAGSDRTLRPACHMLLCDLSMAECLVRPCDASSMGLRSPRGTPIPSKART